MATPTSREELKQYALRKLGAPVIEINVDDAQLEDSIDDAMQIFNEYHFDGVERALFKHKITQAEIDQGFIDTDSIGFTGGNDYPQPENGSKIISVTKVFQFDEGGAGTNMFSVRYQTALQDLYGLRSMGDMTNYSIAQSYISMLSDILSPEKQIRFTRVTNRLYIDMSWTETVTAGDFVLIDTYVALDPDTYTEIYNDILLKKYVVASFRKQWGMNLIKYQGINLPGGVQFDGQALVSQGNEEMEKIEDTLQDKYELPPDIMVG